MKAAKSIDELYEEVKDYDLVLCNDAPLALALNNRLDKAIVGTFATTPRRIAMELSLDILKKSTMSDIELVKRISELTGYRLRFVHGEVENIQTILRYKSDAAGYLRGRSRRVLQEYSQLPTLDNVMNSFDGKEHEYYKGKEIAVIGDELFDNLDKHMLPGLRYDPIDLFKGGEYTIPEIREVGNDRQIAECAVSLIPKGDATDYAIVMDTGSGIADAVRSALYRNRIPFKNSLVVRDLNHIREFLEFIRLSLTFDTVRVSQVRELISSYGGKMSSKHDNYLATNMRSSGIIREGRTSDLLNLMKDIRSHTYLEVCETAADRKKGAQIKVLLEEMGLTDSVVNENDTDDLFYAVNNIDSLRHNEQIPDSEKDGVLLIDCKNSTYIDRPVVIFLGMGTEWDRDLSFLNQIDYRLKSDENEKNLERFQVLLQQGSQRIYITKSTSGGKIQRPCSMFSLSTDDSVESFKDVCERMVQGTWVPKTVPITFSRGEVSLTPEKNELVFSKTSYNRFVSCPRMYMYGALTGTPDSKYTVSGNLIHEYAEMRINYPEIAKKRGTQFYIEEISKICEPLYPPEIRAIELSKIRNSVDNIDAFVDRYGLDRHPEPNEPMDNEKPNRFIIMEGKDKVCDRTERRFASDDGTMEGIFDMVDGIRIYDLKTGAPHNINEMAKGFELDDMKTKKEFQPFFYISLLEEKNPGREVEFSLFFSNDNLQQSTLGQGYDISSNLRKIKLKNDKSSLMRNEGQVLFQAKTYEDLMPYWDQFCDTALEMLTDEIGRESAEDRMKSIIGKNTKTAATMITRAFNKIEDFRKEIIIIGDMMYITRKGLEDFRSMVCRDHSSATEMMEDTFPSENRVECKSCEFRDMCLCDIKTEGDMDV